MYKLTRRHVIATLSGSAVMLCPAILTAQTDLNETLATDWADIPTTTPIGYDQLMEVDAGPAEVEISALQPGEVAVIARPTDDENYSATGQIQYVAVLHRTEDQIAFGAENDRDGTVQTPEYLVVNLVCPHRGKALGITGDPSLPFACTDRGERHSSDFDASGHGVSGGGEGDNISVPDYTLAADGDTLTLSLA